VPDPTAPTRPREHSTRLRPDVSLYAARDGHLLRVGDRHHRVHLDPVGADALLDALVRGGTPTVPAAQAALAALAEAGLVDPPPRAVTVAGTGRLAGVLRAALTRMGASLVGGPTVTALDDEHDLPATGRACWVADHLVVLAPASVPARDVAARHRAATCHRDADAVTAPTGRRVVAAAPAAGLELAAAVVAAELLRPPAPDAPPAARAVVVDLRTLEVTRHPVLPVPPVPAR
jgi:hypothetical protein